ncbi:MAG: hypothetical protein HUJ68_08505 [Clostridia bacterium]|nr:hypothetical protein [Clostridia bacterium]
MENPDKLKNALEKRKATCLKKYGTDNVSKNNDIKDKTAETCLKRYGCKSILGTEKINALGQKAAHSKEAYEKRKQTCLKRYGVEHHMQNKDIQEKLKKTYKNFTGFDHPMHNPKVKQAMIEKYGEIGRVKGYYFNDIHFDSSWELAFYIYLTDNNKSFIYHPNFSFTYIGDDNQEHIYLPDFLVEGQFYEIKGTQFFNEKGEPYNMYTKTYWWDKYNSLIKNNVKILLKDDIKVYLEYVKKEYGKHFLSYWKLK